MTALRAHIDELRTATATLAIETGSSCDPPRESGSNHLLEHLALGTARPALGGLTAYEAAESFGARLDGGTDRDSVTFSVSVPADRLAQAIELLTALGSAPAPSSDEFQAELEVVALEIARDRDDARESAHELLYAAAFPDEALGKPILGQEQELAWTSPESLAATASRWWTPERTSLSCAGQLAALPESTPAFADASSPQTGEDRLLSAPNAFLSPRDVEASYLRLWFDLPDHGGSPQGEWAALVVLALLLGGSLSSRLGRDLRDTHQLCYSLYAQIDWHRQARGLRVMVAADPERAPEAVTRALAVIEGMAARPVSAAELERGKSMAKAELLLDSESTKNLTEHLLATNRALGSPLSIDAAVGAIDALGAEDVWRAAQSALRVPAFACIGPHRASDFREVDPGWELLAEVAEKEALEEVKNG